MAQEKTDEGDTYIKFTKVRRGMGGAKYSTMITTIPSEVCKDFHITEKDTVTWKVDRAKHEAVISRTYPNVSDKLMLLLDIAPEFAGQANAKLPKRIQELLMQAKQMRNDYTGSARNPEEENKIFEAYAKAYAELKKYMEKKKEEGKE